MQCLGGAQLNCFPKKKMLVCFPLRTWTFTESAGEHYATLGAKEDMLVKYTIPLRKSYVSLYRGLYSPIPYNLACSERTVQIELKKIFRCVIQSMRISVIRCVLPKTYRRLSVTRCSLCYSSYSLLSVFYVPLTSPCALWLNSTQYYMTGINKR